VHTANIEENASSGRLQKVKNNRKSFNLQAQNAGVCSVLAPVEGLFSNRNIGQICLIYIFCFILLFTSSLPYRKDHSAVLYFLQVIIVQIQVYNWEFRHHSTVCRCGLADILYFDRNQP